MRYRATGVWRQKDALESENRFPRVLSSVSNYIADRFRFVVNGSVLIGVGAMLAGLYQDWRTRDEMQKQTRLGIGTIDATTLIANGIGYAMQPTPNFITAYLLIEQGQLAMHRASLSHLPEDKRYKIVQKHQENLIPPENDSVSEFRVYIKSLCRQYENDSHRVCQMEAVWGALKMLNDHLQSSEENPVVPDPGKTQKFTNISRLRMSLLNFSYSSSR